MKVYHNLKPIYNKQSKILILGSMPSPISRKMEFYYANTNNRFWKIFENLFHLKLDNFKKIKKFLLKNKIALWDVIYSCDIACASDSTIKNVIPNNINEIIKESKIRYIFVTGKIALKYYDKYIYDKTKIKAIYLPSPSSANAKYNLEKLISEYQIILRYL